MKHTVLSIVLLGLAVIGGAFTQRRIDKLPQHSSESTPEMPCYDEATVTVDYISLSLPERIKNSAFVLTGVITAISPTKWNQDSGEYWEDWSPDKETRYVALPYFTLEISNISSLASTIELGDSTLITVVGKSPIGCEHVSDISLGVGRRVIVFGKKTELSWRNGRRPIFGLVADPAQSILILGSDGRFHSSAEASDTGIALEDLREMIAGSL